MVSEDPIPFSPNHSGISLPGRTSRIAPCLVCRIFSPDCNTKVTFRKCDDAREREERKTGLREIPEFSNALLLPVVSDPI